MRLKIRSILTSTYIFPLRIFIFGIFIFGIFILSISLSGKTSQITDCLTSQLNTPKTSSHHDSRNILLKETETFFQESDQLRFFLGEKEMPFPSGELQPGHTYTVIVHNNKLILGRNIPGKLDDIIGGRGSHDTLTNYIKNTDKELYKPDSYDHKAGAIGIKSDGTVVISGFHNKGSSQKSMDAITKIIKDISPHSKIEATPGELRLNDPIINPLKPIGDDWKIIPKTNPDVILKEAEQYFQQSKDVIFFDGAIKPLKDNLNFPSGEFKVGNTYTVIIVDNKLVIGKNTPGLSNPLDIGGRGSHVKLYHFVDPNPNKDPFKWKGQAGSIGIGKDGTINISGYHREEKNLKSAEKIESLILKICPYCKTNTTEGTLEQLGHIIKQHQKSNP